MDQKDVWLTAFRAIHVLASRPETHVFVADWLVSQGCYMSDIPLVTESDAEGITAALADGLKLPVGHMLAYHTALLSLRLTSGAPRAEVCLPDFT